MNSLKPIKKSSISLQVFEQLLNLISTGAWPPNTAIASEKELSSRLGVSRVSIRSALEKLKVLDLIETKQGEGSFVKGFSSDVYMNSLIPMIVLDKINLLDINQFRKIVECGTVSLVIDNATTNDIKELQKIINRMEESQTDLEAFAIEDTRFHRELAKISGNSVLFKIQNILKDILIKSMQEITNLLGTEKGIYYHKKILEAIIKKDKEKCEEIMSRHLDVNINKIKELIDKDNQNKIEKAKNN
jgi:GntR family transcriptional regulator, transcriptional repressor for pyruvate dehydrogenase complex